MMQQRISNKQKNNQQPVATNLSEQSSVNRFTFQLQDNRSQSTIQKKANNTGLPDNLKSGIENLSGHSMDDVKVHYNSSKPAQLNAHAYAQGSEIHVASGQEKHLPHEAWHVVQQKQGRVKPTLQLKGKYINDNRPLEKEANRMGALALGSEEVIQGAFFGKFLTVLALLAVYFSRADAMFAGTNGPLMNGVFTPPKLKVEGTEYEHLWKSLSDSPTRIYVENGPASFNPSGPKGATLYLSGGHLQTMSKGIKAFRERGKASATKADEQLVEEFAHGLSMVTHELSHAADSVIDGKELIGEKGTKDPGAKVLNVISTELTAWASEAKIIKEVGRGDKALLDSWNTLNEKMMQSWTQVKKNKGTNVVVDRYYRYLGRNLADFEGAAADIAGWHREHVAEVWGLMQAQQRRVAGTGRRAGREDL